MRNSTIRLAGISVVALMLSCGASVVSAVEDGEVFGNWTVRCENDTASGVRECFVSQSIVLKAGGQRVLNVDIGFAPQRDQPVALVTLPLGISLPPGGSLQVDDHEVQHFHIERCEPSGCRGGLVLKEPLLGWLHGGQQATIGFYDAERQRLDIPLRLAGLTEGLKALQVP